jgi:hypothetical protein
MHDAWVVAGVTFVVLLVSAGLVSAGVRATPAGTGQLVFLPLLARATTPAGWRAAAPRRSSPRSRAARRAPRSATTARRSGARGRPVSP